MFAQTQMVVRNGCARGGLTLRICCARGFVCWLVLLKLSCLEVGVVDVIPSGVCA